MQGHHLRAPRQRAVARVLAYFFWWVDGSLLHQTKQSKATSETNVYNGATSGVGRPLLYSIGAAFVTTMSEDVDIVQFLDCQFHVA